MTLILGLHLPKRIFLVSDTRLTHGDGSFTDNIIKAVNINDSITSIWAGNAAAASFLAKKIKDDCQNVTHVEDLKELITEKIQSYSSEYVNSTGRYGYVACIFGGFTKNGTKKINSTKLGEIMSADIRNIEGKLVPQNIDPQLLSALKQALIEKKKLGPNELIDSEIPDSKLISLTLDIQTNKYTINEVPLFEFAIFHPGKQIQQIELPAKIISQLEFRHRTSTNPVDNIFDDTAILATFVENTIRQYDLKTVGGYIFPLQIIPNSKGSIFPSGKLGFKNSSSEKIEFIGELTIRNGDFIGKKENGQEYKFILLEEFLDRNKSLQI